MTIVSRITSVIRKTLIFEFDSGNPDVLIIQQQIKCTSNTSTFILYDRLHVSTLIGSSSGLQVELSQ